MREKLAKIGAFVAVAGMALTGLANELPYIYGAQYYRAPTPTREHWAGDLAAIKAKGFNTVKYWVQWRWSERVEGEYVWDDLDELMVLAEKNDLKGVLNLILDVMPEWVEGKHPDALMVDRDGRRVGPTAPAHRQLNGYPGPCYSHKEVTAKRQRFTRAAYEHFKRFPALFAWDVWNEPERMSAHRTNDRIPALCFCENCKRDFKVWLKDRYGTIEKLNAVWGRCYTSFDAVETPVDVCCVTDFVDWREFQKDVLQGDADWRLNLLREIDPSRHPHLHVVLACGIFSPAVAVDDFEIARKCELFGSTMMNQPYACAQGISAAQGRFYYNAEWHLNYGSINRYQRVIGRDAFLYDQLAQIGWGIKGCLFWQYRPESLGVESPAWGLIRPDGSDRPVVKHAEEFAKAFAPYAETYLACRRPDPKVLVWRSARNEIFQYCRYGGVSRYHAGLAAWCDALYDLNVPFAICDTEMLETGFFKDVDVLILSQAMYLGERDVKAFRAFAQSGKTVLSEMNLGAYDSDRGRFSATVPGFGLAADWDVQEVETTAAFHLPTNKKSFLKAQGMDDVAKAMQASRVRGSDSFTFDCADGTQGIGAYDFASLGTADGTTLATFRGTPIVVKTAAKTGAHIYYCGTQLGVAVAEKSDCGFLCHALRAVLNEIGVSADDRGGVHEDILVDGEGRPHFAVYVNRSKKSADVTLPPGDWKRLLGDGSRLDPETAALYVK
ncbi:MAG: beta-galactosidase [bacterium]|nr:beta-galactosidase [Candidatus Colisoma equi]